jgi:hypothetical protein
VNNNDIWRWKARKMMNAAARSIFLCEAGGYIRHPSISIRELSLYRKDGVHLSTTGNAIFVNDMQGDLNILYLGITKLKVFNLKIEHSIFSISSFALTVVKSLAPR